MYTCTNCDEIFLNKQTLDKHKNMCKRKDYALEYHLESLANPSKGQPKIHDVEKPYSCTKCEFKNPNKETMKIHMDSHKEKTIYVCDVTDCYYESGKINKLNEHKKTHDSRWSDIVKSPPRINQAHKHQDQSNKGKHPNRQNHIPEKDHHTNDSQKKPNGFIMGSSRNSQIYIPPRPHWAHVFATGFSPRTTANEVKRDIEYSLEIKTGKIHYCDVYKEETRYNTYSSFLISCRCVNSEVFMDSTIWPENCKVKWYKHNRSNNKGVNSPHRK